MPKLTPNPIPKKRFHGGRWRIYWYWNYKLFTIPTNHFDPKTTTRIDQDLRHMSSALAMDEPEFPDEYADCDAVRDYIQARFNLANAEELREGWLTAYQRVNAGTVGKRWAEKSMWYLNRLSDFAGDVKKVTPDQAQEFLTAFLAGTEQPGKTGTPRSPSSHNKALATCSKFYGWAVRTHRTRKNPFDGITQIREPKKNDIVFCTKTQRRDIIKLAHDTGWPDWMIVPIAFYAGMRREEIARMKWRDVRFKEGLIVITKTKTDKSRETPLNKHLELMLKRIPESERIGYVIKMPCDTGDEEKDESRRINRMTNFIH